MSDGELVDHLLLHCEIAHALWLAIFSWFGLHWVMPGRVEDLYACWTGGRFRTAVIWKMIPFTLFTKTAVWLTLLVISFFSISHSFLSF
jgi:hypothetical protein